jgi:hypothetical protein
LSSEAGEEEIDDHAFREAILIDSARTVFVSVRVFPRRAFSSYSRSLAGAGLCMLILLLGAASDARGAGIDAAAQAASKSLEAKVDVLGGKNTKPAASYPAVVITEYEVNSYLKVHSGESFPLGVHDPTVKIQPEHVVGNTRVDFDELSRSYPNQTDWGPKVLSAMFKGVQPVTITAGIQSESTGVRVLIESVVVGSTTVPKWLVDYIIQNVLQPKYHFDLSKPLPYTDHVRQVVLGSGQVTFLRGPKPNQ